MQALIKTASEVREALKTEMPANKFQVRANRHGGWDETIEVRTNIETLTDPETFWAIARRFETRTIVVDLLDLND